MINDSVVYSIENYLTSDQCDELIALFDATPTPDNSTDPDWLGRVKWPTYTEDQRILLRIKRQEIFESFYEVKSKMINLNMTLWRIGHFMPPHSDYGKVLEYTNREFASMLYLNDDFEGGELYIPELNFINKPKKGQLVFFRGGKYRHGVTKVTSGRRITSGCWFEILGT